MKCSRCKSNKMVKAGFTPSGTQRYQCSNCGNRFTTENKVDNRVSKNSAAVLKLRNSGESLREVARKIGINHQTVANLQNDKPCVYIAKIGEGGIYKIGKTRNIKQRARAIEKLLNQNVAVIYFGGRDHNNLEKHLHNVFCDFRIDGEYFRLGVDQLEIAINIIENW